jgi:hypothetical protein
VARYWGCRVELDPIDEEYDEEEESGDEEDADRGSLSVMEGYEHVQEEAGDGQEEALLFESDQWGGEGGVQEEEVGGGWGCPDTIARMEAAERLGGKTYHGVSCSYGDYPLEPVPPPPRSDWAPPQVSWGMSTGIAVGVGVGVGQQSHYGYGAEQRPEAAGYGYGYGCGGGAGWGSPETLARMDAGKREMSNNNANNHGCKATATTTSKAKAGKKEAFCQQSGWGCPATLERIAAFDAAASGRRPLRQEVVGYGSVKAPTSWMAAPEKSYMERVNEVRGGVR